MMQPLQEPRGCLVPQALLWSSALDPQAPSGTVCCFRPKTSRAPRSKAGCGLQASSSSVQRKSTSAAVSPGRFSQASLGGDGASLRTNNRQARPVSQTRMSILKVHATFSLVTLELLRGEGHSIRTAFALHRPLNNDLPLRSVQAKLSQQALSVLTFRVAGVTPSFPLSALYHLCDL